MGTDLKCARIRKGISGRELSRQIGVHYVTLSRIENGKQVPNLKTVIKICRILGIDLNTVV